MNVSYTAFVGDGGKGANSRYRKLRADNMPLHKPRRLGNVREAVYFYLGEEFMRR